MVTLINAFITNNKLPICHIIINANEFFYCCCFDILKQFILLYEQNVTSDPLINNNNRHWEQVRTNYCIFVFVSSNAPMHRY
jgi:hypothetical protein